MANPPVPFFAQTAVLDKYIHSPNPGVEPEILEIIIEALKTKPELREYFFRNGPNPVWAKILWEHGFFQTPPLPLETKEGSFLRHWDVQIYLDMVADQVPEIVLQHVLEFQGHGWYISRALHALVKTPSEIIEQAVPKLLEWLKDPTIASHIDDESCELMFKLAEGRRKAPTFALFKALTTPVQKGPPESTTYEFWSGAAVQTTAEHLLDRKDFRRSLLQILEDLDLLKYSETLEENLRSLLDMEAQIYSQPRLKNSSWWRSAIEDTSQDFLDRDRDNLLSSLRSGLESQLKIDANLVSPIIARFLSNPYRLFYRLGLYLLSVKPDHFIEIVTQILLTPDNYADDEIRHEFFTLLEATFRLLTYEQQDTILSIILNGPPQAKLNTLAQRFANESEEDTRKLIEKYIKRWMRDRLWMVRDYLLPVHQEILREIVVELGEPEHPTFLTWTSKGYWVKQVPPLTDQELAEITPLELVQFLNNWKPDSQQRFGPTEISYEGLASSLGKLVVGSFDKYSPYLYELAAARADYATSILNHLSEPEYEITNWDALLGLCESLLANDTFRKSSETTKGNWKWVRSAIVKILEKGLRKNTPYEQIERFRDLLLILTDDPSPTPEEDRPPEGQFGHSDPMAVAINYTRPMAVNALIEYARVRANNLNIGDVDFSAANRLEDEVQKTLSNKLVPSLEPSLAVRSVFGGCTDILYWLNKEWWLSNLDAIFPDVIDSDSLLLFAAAWDSFITRPFHIYLFDYLRPKYLQAITLAAKGQSTKPSFYSPISYLAGHLFWEYLLGGTELPKPINLDDSLLKIFFTKTTPESRGLAVATCSQILRRHQNVILKYWPKVRAFWEWRAYEASAAGYTVDFQDEMIHFAEILPIVPESETLNSLWNLLETLLPYVTRSEYRNHGWDSVEEFLLTRFEHEPVRSIQFYNLLWNQRKTRPNWYHHSDEAIKLVTLAIENPLSRHDAFRLIDFLARWGDYTFKSLYERYS
ncbi:MAG: hypothetical protein A2W35_21315 [Chloroflexi bacterium RBG_16_57_11]|nr:MAG: hypothetical protein A2W35_21315 [Chloroflexi bacterium RBG_16_57_11]